MKALILAVDRILAALPMDELGHIADCGFDANDEKCDCYSLRGRLADILRDLLGAERTLQACDVARLGEGLDPWQVVWVLAVWHHPDGRMAKLKVRDFEANR